MKNRKIFKNILNRKQIKKNENKRLFLKYVYLHSQIECKALKVKVQFLYLVKNLESVLSKSQTICLFSGRTRGVYKQFKISRIKFREFASYGKISGVVKSS